MALVDVYECYVVIDAHRSYYSILFTDGLTDHATGSLTISNVEIRSMGINIKARILY